MKLKNVQMWLSDQTLPSNALVICPDSPLGLAALEVSGATYYLTMIYYASTIY